MVEFSKQALLEQLLSFKAPLNVDLFDNVVAAFYNGGSPQVSHQVAHEVLAKFQEHPDSWTTVTRIWSDAKVPQSKVIALNVLSDCIRYRWLVLPLDSKKGMKNFLENSIVNYSRKDGLDNNEQTLLTKLNGSLIEILKQEWPQNWQTFISDMVKLSQQKESVCTNSMKIFQMLSEEIKAPQGETAEITREKREHLSKSLANEFEHLFKLCLLVLERCNNKALLEQTLKTFAGFITWMPVDYIFDTSVLQMLTMKFYPSQFQSQTLECLTEIVGLPLDTSASRQKLQAMIAEAFGKIHACTLQILSPDQDMKNHIRQHGANVVAYFRQYTNFMAVLVTNHLNVLESTVNEALLQALMICVRITEVEDVELLKITLDLWKFLVTDLKRTVAVPSVLSRGAPFGLAQLKTDPRFEFYKPLLTQLRKVLITRMVRPKEVLIMEDENGDIVKQEMKDTVNLMIYEQMKITLHVLTELDPHDTRGLMMGQLDKQMDPTLWKPHNLNVLCWAIGSISGAMSEDLEKNFLVHVIKILLGLCEVKKGKKNKAVIAANIMYVVRKYPRFLQKHWKFLKTVVNKLIEFMHERFPGVQDMAVETMMEIIQTCKMRFVKPQGSEPPFINEIIHGLPSTIKDLQDQQIFLLYEALGVAVSAESNPHSRGQMLFSLMEVPNKLWQELVERAKSNPMSIMDENAMTHTRHIININIRVCRSVEAGYFVQFSRVFEDALGIYSLYSKAICKMISQDGDRAASSHQLRLYVALKNDILKWLEEFLKRISTSDFQKFKVKIIPPILETILGDYKNAVVATKSPFVLSLCCQIISRLGGEQEDGNYIINIYENIFMCTLDMIRGNMEDHTEHRLKFFVLLRVTNKRAFKVMFQGFPSGTLETIIKSVTWAFRHLDKNISEMGLAILEEMLANVENSNIRNEFFKTYLMHVLTNVFEVLTDRLHKSSFTTQAKILQKIFRIVRSGTITVPLWDQSKTNCNSNQQHLNQEMVKLLAGAFKHLTPQVINTFVVGLFHHSNEAGKFIPHIRDFLVQTKEFQCTDNSELFKG